MSIWMGHTRSVLCVAFSPDGETIAAAAGAKDWGSVYLWNTASRRQASVVRGHTSYVYTLAYSKDGTLLASGSDDGTIQLWNTRSAKAERVLKGTGKSFMTVAFSPDMNLIASDYNAPRNSDFLNQTNGGHVRFWNVKTGEVVDTFRAHELDAGIVAFSPDGKLLATGGFDGTIKIWDAAKRTLRATLRGHTSYVWSLAFSPDGKRLASGEHGQGAKIWDVASWELTDLIGLESWLRVFFNQATTGVRA